MLPVLLRDNRLQKIFWKDLVPMSHKEVAIEIVLSAPWLIGSLVFASVQWYPAALICSFFFFLTGLRQSHNAQHNSVGISKRATEWFLFSLSILMFASMHAVKYNHLQHHKNPLGEEDVEAFSAKIPGWKALIAGPYFIFTTQAHALKNANKYMQRWIIIELISIALILLLAFLVIKIDWLTYHVVAMLTGECFTAFFAVWTVHHDCDEINFSRTVRGSWRTKLFYNMFYHTEHHLFPKVPTCHLHQLAERIDAVIPEIKTKTVL